MDEDEVMDGWNKRLAGTVGGVGQVVVHGHKTVYAQGIKLLFDLQFTVVGDPHGVPSDDFVTFHFGDKGT